MHRIYGLVSGPLAWAAFILFFGGSLYRLISMAVLARRKDPVVYEYMSLRFALRSLVHWVLPFASLNMRRKPLTTLVGFAFHLCLLAAPVFLLAHVILWKEYWNVSWWNLPDGVVDFMTVIVMAGCLFFFVRRLVLPEVRFLTGPSDFAILAVAAAPFVTGFWAYHQLPGHEIMGIVHMVSGEILLAAIPFTRLSHMLFFPFTRAYMGSEFGGVRHARDW